MKKLFLYIQRRKQNNFLTVTEVGRVVLYNNGAAEIKEERNILMEDAKIILERHEQKILAIEKEISDLKSVQSEIRAMNETLVTLATELKHTNEHLARHERKIDEMENQPKVRMQQIVTAIIAALAGGLISTIVGLILA